MLMLSVPTPRVISKTSGGLARRTGMTEKQRSLWRMSTPITAEYNYAMHEFNILSRATSKKHKEATQARIQGDNSDPKRLKTSLADYVPFSQDQNLRNIVNSVVAEDDVNVELYINSNQSEETLWTK